MFDPESDVADVYVNPGEMFFARQPTVIRTLLGSCVGVTFWNARLKVGALCHGMLPKCPSDPPDGSPPESRYRFVDFAIRDIARKFDELGAQRSEVEVKVFGGADVLLGENGQLRRPTVGSLNCDSALDVLGAEGFKVIASSLRGTKGLNIHFNTGSGEVRLRRLEDCSTPAASRHKTSTSPRHKLTGRGV
jgi:chemotaxis protein CheD